MNIPLSQTMKFIALPNYLRRATRVSNLSAPSLRPTPANALATVGALQGVPKIHEPSPKVPMLLDRLRAPVRGFAVAGVGRSSQIFGVKVKSQADFEACAALLRQSYELMAEDSGHPMAYIPKRIIRDLLLPKSTATHLRERCAKDKIVYWLMRDRESKEPVGMIGVSTIKGDCPTGYEAPNLVEGGHRLLQYTVRPELRGQGYGRVILDMGHKLIEDLNPQKVYFLAPAGPKLLALLKSGYVWVPEGDHFHEIESPETGWLPFNLSRIKDESLINQVKNHPDLELYREKLNGKKLDRFCLIHPTMGNGLPEGVVGIRSGS